MKYWSAMQYNEDELATLRRMFDEYYSLADIGIALHRSKCSVAQRVRKLKLKRDYHVVRLVTLHGPEVLAIANDKAAIKAMIKQQRIADNLQRAKHRVANRQQVLTKMRTDLRAGCNYDRTLKTAYHAGCSIRLIATELKVTEWHVQSRVTTSRRLRERLPDWP